MATVDQSRALLFIFLHLCSGAPRSPAPLLLPKMMKIMSLALTAASAFALPVDHRAERQAMVRT
eukprot:COSAG06_NODE_722_length_12802_cov_6.036763_11_plen_64_part_00